MTHQHDIGLLVEKALCRANATHHALGAHHGLKEIRKNEHGETALAVDIACEKAVISVFENSGLPVLVHSEEHGVFTMGHGTPEFLIIIDGIDGTAVCRENWDDGGYGTIVGVFKGANPQYKDYMACGIAQHAHNKILMGRKGRGAFHFSLKSKRYSAIHTSMISNPWHHACADEYFKVVRKTFSEPLRLLGFTVRDPKCSCLSYAEVAEGLGHFTLECTRGAHKPTLEIPIAYGLVREAGGVMVDLQGQDIGPQKYLEFGQREQIPIITAANQALADKLIKLLASTR